jgi:SAM-dependent methyltransferase
MDFLSTSRPGRALDLGCSTGTNAITMTKHGWEVTGVDFSLKAIRSARHKAGRLGLTIDFRVGDVADLRNLSGPYDYALDIGCLFTLREERRGPYVAGLERLLRPGSPFMLYAWLPRPHRGRPRGLTPEEVKTLFRECFELTRIEFGKENGAGSAWYWFRKRAAAPSSGDQ